jgi:excisionase family DNA binding protein
MFAQMIVADRDELREMSNEQHEVTVDSPTMESFVTAAEVAKYLSLSPRTVAKMAREGRLPAHRISGSERKTWRFRISEVAAFVSSGMQH